MSQHRVALRYAKSLLELAKEEKIVDQIKKDMLLLKDTCKVSGPFRAMLKNPEIQGDKKFNVLNALYQDKVHKVTIAFYKIVVKKRRESHLATIAEEFHNLYNNYKGIQETHITTTFPIEQELRSEFERVAREISGKNPEVVEHVDKDIIGGFVLKVDDQQLDSSIRSKLNELRLKLTK